MTNLNPVRALTAVTAVFTAFLLISGVVSQDLAGIQPPDREGVKDLALAFRDAAAAPSLTITPITWNVAGLDSNDVTTGPNVFPVGARLCNTGSTAATNVASAFVWDTANARINLRAGSNAAINIASLSAGACTDLYYEIELVRAAATHNTARRYHITATADTLGVVSTPTPREIYVEKILSQARNSVLGIKLNGMPIGLGGTMNMVVGNTYLIQLSASTATNGYDQIQTFINLPNVIFQTLSVTSSYSAPTGYTGDKLYEDACGWDSNPDPLSGTYKSCIGPAGVAGGKAGGTVTLNYTVKVLSGGGTSQTLNTLIQDFSGSSFHYNSDFSAAAVFAQILFPPSAANVSVGGRLISADGRGITNARVSLTEADGTVHTAVTGRRGFYVFEDIEDGQTIVVSVGSRRFTFSEPVRVLSLTDNIADLDFHAN